MPGSQWRSATTLTTRPRRGIVTFEGCTFLSFTMPGQSPAGIGGPSVGNDPLAEVNRVAGLHWKVP
jgi:hypothetical protein